MKDKVKIEVKEKYPKFISNNPCGSDKFEGRSQERLVQAIATHITNNESTDGNENNGGDMEELTDYFISKTFPIVYHVPLPVMTDAQNFLNELYQEAFGTTEETDKELIIRAFRLDKPKATARDMIELINQLVALKNIWNDEIELRYMAIYL